MDINVVDMDYLLDELEQKTSGFAKTYSCFNKGNMHHDQQSQASECVVKNEKEDNDDPTLASDSTIDHSAHSQKSTFLYQETEKINNGIKDEYNVVKTTISSLGENTEKENAEEQNVEEEDTEISRKSTFIIRNEAGSSVFLQNFASGTISDKEFSTGNAIEIQHVCKGLMNDESIEHNISSVDYINEIESCSKKDGNITNFGLMEQTNIVVNGTEETPINYCRDITSVRKCERDVNPPIENVDETGKINNVDTDVVFIRNNFNEQKTDVVVKFLSTRTQIAKDISAVIIESNKGLQFLQKSKEICDSYSSDTNADFCIEAIQSCSTKADVIADQYLASPTVEKENSEINNKSVVESTHDISVFSGEFKLTESELLLGKVKPYWIPDEDCDSCMLCSNKFTLVNRRHHCRSCGRVLCGACCQIRRVLPYMLGETDQRKQRICSPCNRTLDRIEMYNKFINDTNTLSEQPVDGACGENDTIMHDSSQQSSNVLLQRKKSVLKVRIPLQIDSVNEESNFPALDSPTGAPLVNYAASQSIISLIANTTLEGDFVDTGRNSNTQPPIKRSVTFRDGVNPGDDNPGVFVIKNNVNAVSSSFKKSSKRLSRKMMEKRADEENVNLLERCSHLLCVKNCESELLSTNIEDVWEQIVCGKPTSIAIRRNIYVIFQLTELTTLNNNNLKQVVSVSTRGFNSIGADELVIMIECGENTFNVCYPNDHNPENILEGEKYIKNKSFDDVFESNKTAVNQLNHAHLLDMLKYIERIFSSCISPPSVNTRELDDRLGIRRCSRRMKQFYEIPSGSLSGVESSALYLCRLNGQVFGNVLLPNTPFFVGILLKQSETVWGNCIPNRILFAIGKQSLCYPTPIINARVRDPIFSTEATNHSVLKVLNDFRKFSYQIAQIEGSYVSLMDSETKIIIPVWARDQLKLMIETNRNMFGWALDFNTYADSHLTCLEEKLNNEVGDDYDISFKTHIFSKRGAVREVTGSSFIIFDGALRVVDLPSSGMFAVSVVEDGVIIRMSPDTMTALVKQFLAGEDFELQAPQMHLKIHFVEDPFNLNTLDDNVQSVGKLLSPIDGTNITGKYQYGLIIGRALRSLCHFPSCSEWALRLGAVINLDMGGFGKFPSMLQSKYFETCEQLATYVCITLDPYVGALVYANQKEIYVRIRVDDENATYETAKWSYLEDQHYMWTLALDEQIIPILYGLCPLVSAANSGSTSGFHVELHMQIVSIRPLHFCCITSSLRT